MTFASETESLDYTNKKSPLSGQLIPTPHSLHYTHLQDAGFWIQRHTKALVLHKYHSSSRECCLLVLRDAAVLEFDTSSRTYPLVGNSSLKVNQLHVSLLFDRCLGRQRQFCQLTTYHTVFLRFPVVGISTHLDLIFLIISGFRALQGSSSTPLNPIVAQPILLHAHRPCERLLFDDSHFRFT